MNDYECTFVSKKHLLHTKMSVPHFGFESSADHAIKDDGVIIFLGFVFMIICVALLARYD